MSDDFEVSIFLTELSSRHSVLTKQKIFKDKARIQSNSGKLTNWLTTGTSDQPVLIDEDAANPIVVRDEDDDEPINLADIPEAEGVQKPARRSVRDKRRREDLGLETTSSGSDSDDSELFVTAKSAKRNKTDDTAADTEEEGIEDLQDDKKRLGMNTSYDGFSIYGRILCLVVKRRGTNTTAGGAAPTSSAQMLETWVSTQAVAEQVDDDEDGA
jgi:hypothetical protein